jgi:hypothetical protein
MAGFRNATDDRTWLGGLVLAGGLAALAGAALLLAPAPQRSSEPSVVPSVSVAPVATLPPTVVVGSRTDAYGGNCGRGERVAKGRCVLPDFDREWAAAPASEDPPAATLPPAGPRP